MRFEWDPLKAQANLEKHGVDFADAAVAPEDELAVTVPDPCADDEERFVTLCADPLARVLVVVYTWRDERMRLISARQATRRERQQYEVG